MQSSDKTFILGDFNCPDIDWPTFSSDYTFSSSLCDLLFQYDFTQVIDCWTHVHGKILDLILTNSPDSVATITVSKEFNSTVKSDHYIVSCDLHFTSTQRTPASELIYIFGYSKGDYEGLNNLLCSVHLSTCFLSNDVGIYLVFIIKWYYV